MTSGEIYSYHNRFFRYILPATEDLAASAKGQPVAAFDAYRRGIWPASVSVVS
jgi:hypothetical protein